MSRRVFALLSFATMPLFTIHSIHTGVIRLDSYLSDPPNTPDPPSTSDTPDKPLSSTRYTRQLYETIQSKAIHKASSPRMQVREFRQSR